MGGGGGELIEYRGHFFGFSLVNITNQGRDPYMDVVVSWKKPGSIRIV